MRHGLAAAILISQQHCGSPPQLTDHCQEATITAESWILLTAVQPDVASPFDPAAAAHQAGGQHQQQKGRSKTVQSSKRELLSRGRGVVLFRGLREAGRLLTSLRLDSGRAPFVRLLVGARLALKAASSASGRDGLAAVAPRSAEVDSEPPAEARPTGRLPRLRSFRSLRRSPKSARRSSRTSPARNLAILRDRSLSGLLQLC